MASRRSKAGSPWGKREAVPARHSAEDTAGKRPRREKQWAAEKVIGKVRRVPSSSRKKRGVAVRRATKGRDHSDRHSRDRYTMDRHPRIGILTTRKKQEANRRVEKRGQAEGDQ